MESFTGKIDNDLAKRMNEYINEVNLLFQSKKFENMLKDFAKKNKLSIEAASNLLISYLLTTLVKVAKETKNIGLLDVIYLIYVDFSKQKFLKKYGTATTELKKSTTYTHRKSVSKSPKARTPSRKPMIHMFTRIPQRQYGGGRKLVIREGIVTEIDDSEEQAFEIIVPTSETLRRTGVEESIIEIIREGKHMKIGILSLNAGDIILSQLKNRSEMVVSAQLAEPCAGGARSTGCSDRIISKIGETDPILAVALGAAQSDPEMKDLVNDILKQTLRNKAKAAQIEANELKEYEKELKAMSMYKKKKSENAIIAEEVVKDVLKNRGLTCGEVGHCVSGALLEGTKWAILVKFSSHILNSGVENVQRTISESLDKMSNSSDTLNEGAKAVKHTVSTLDWVGGKFFGGVNTVFDTVNWASTSCGYKGPVLRNGQIEYVCLDSEPPTEVPRSALRGRATDAAIQAELIAQAAIDAAAAQLQGERQAYEDNYGTCDSSSELFDLGDMCPRMSFINDSGVEAWLSHMRQQISEQMMVELTSWPAYIFYILFIYTLFHNIKEARAEKNRLRIHAAHGATAHQTEVVRDIKLDQNRRIDAQATRSLLVRSGLAIATGGVSELLRPRSPSKSSSAIEIPESRLGGAISGPVRKIARQIKSSETPINIAIEDAISQRPTEIERLAIADVGRARSSSSSSRSSRSSSGSKGGTRRKSNK
jgi:hypothetical protein